MSYSRDRELHAGPGAIAAIDAVTPVRRRLRQKQMEAFAKRDRMLAGLPEARHRMMLGALGTTTYAPSAPTAPPGPAAARTLSAASFANRTFSSVPLRPMPPGGRLPGPLFPRPGLSPASSQVGPVLPSSSATPLIPTLPAPGTSTDTSGGGGGGAGTVTTVPTTSPVPDDGSMTPIPDASDVPASGGISTPTLWLAAGAVVVGLALLFRK